MFKRRLWAHLWDLSFRKFKKSFFGDLDFNSMAYILLPPATKLGQGYVFTSVCDSVHRGAVCLSACWDTPPGSRHPLGSDTPPAADPPGGADTPPWEQTHPLAADTPQQQTPPPGSRHPPGSRPPPAEHAGRYGQRAGGTHPTGMQSCQVNFFKLIL